MSADLRAQLDALDAARQGATPGPWRQAGSMIAEPRHLNTIVDCWEDPADAALIVAAVNNLPALTAAVRAVLNLADNLERNDLPVPSLHGHWVADDIRAAVTEALGGELRG